MSYNAAVQAVKQNQLMSFFALLLLAGTVLLYGFGLGNYGLFDVDEAIFAQTSVEMLHSGDYYKPTYNGEPRFHKPPMIYYLQTASYKLFGVSPMAARLPSAIAGIIMILVFYNSVWLLSRQKRYALIAAAVLAFNLSILMLARAAIADMLLNMLMLSATMLLIGNIYATERSAMRVIVAGFLLGLAVLTKGPVALVLPGAVVGFLVLMKEQRALSLSSVSPVLLLMAALTAVIPWAMLVIDHTSPEFFREFIVRFIGVHNIHRYFDGMGVSNVKPNAWWYYLVVLLLGFFPWVLLIPSAIGGVLKDAWWRIRGHDPRLALPVLGLVWGCIVVALFTFSATKLPHYIAFALPGFALLVADRLDRLGERPLGWFHLLYMVPATLIFAGVFLLLPQLPDLLLGRGELTTLLSQYDLHLAVTDPLVKAVLAQPVDFGIIPIAVGALLILGIGLGFFFMRLGGVEATLFLAVTIWASLGLMALGIAPKVYDLMQQPLAWFGQDIARHYDPATDKVVFLSTHQPSVRFISGAPFIPMDNPTQVPYVRGSKLFVLTDITQMPALEPLLHDDNVTKECLGGFCLVKVIRTGRHY